MTSDSRITDTDGYDLTVTLIDDPPPVVPFRRWGAGIVGWQLPSRVRLLDPAGVVLSDAGVVQTRISLTTPGLFVSLRIGGIGGVRTSAAFQRRGYGARVVREAMAVARAHYQPAALALFTLDPLLDWYERLGFKRVEGAVTIRQPDGQDHALPPGMHLLLDIEEPVTATITVESLPW